MEHGTVVDSSDLYELSLLIYFGKLPKVLQVFGNHYLIVNY